MYIKIDQPSAETERKILKLVRREQLGTKEQDENWQEFSKTVGKISIEDILKARKEVLSMHMSEQLEEYLVQLVGSIGSDPTNGKITTESSLGAALLGKEVGDEIEVICGDGSSYKVIVREIQ